MTVDEELKQLEDNIRKLKIEYDIFFGGGSKRPPTDLDWRVQSTLKKFSDSQRLTFAQRFKFNTIQQKYAIYSDLWRKKVSIKEEGFRRPADAILSIQGIRSEEPVPKKQPQSVKEGFEPLKVRIGDPNAEITTVRTLFDALTNARQHASDQSSGPATFDSFASFVRKKTTEIRSHYKCEHVEYEVELASGKVKLKARPKT
ncbi:MAG TPA: MXAN_5187 C-terminal domain-containing protein [Terriglobales bacterium]|nr:MXAN_5187 C-terminal domain-containing protein [Terriglobales bacterium]